MTLHLKMHIAKRDDIHITPEHLNFYLTKPVFSCYSTSKICSTTVEKVGLKRLSKRRKCNQQFTNLQLWEKK